MTDDKRLEEIKAVERNNRRALTENEQFLLSLVDTLRADRDHGVEVYDSLVNSIYDKFPDFGKCAHEVGEIIEALVEERQTLRAEVKAAREAFGKYGQHNEHCPARMGLDCSCGFEKVFTEAHPPYSGPLIGPGVKAREIKVKIDRVGRSKPLPTEE